MIEYLITFAISCLSVVIGGYVISKIMEKRIETLVNQYIYEGVELLNSEKGQKFLFTVGAIVGNGIKTGVGLNPKKGKFRWEDLIGQIISQYFTQKLPFSPSNSQETVEKPFKF